MKGPVAIADARDIHLRQPIEGKLSILTPVFSTEPSRRAAKISIVVAKAANAPLTALYVAPSQEVEPLAPIRGGDSEGHRFASG